MLYIYASIVALLSFSSLVSMERISLIDLPDGPFGVILEKARKPICAAVCKRWRAEYGPALARLCAREFSEHKHCCPLVQDAIRRTTPGCPQSIFSLAHLEDIQGFLKERLLLVESKFLKNDAGRVELYQPEAVCRFIGERYLPEGDFVGYCHALEAELQGVNLQFMWYAIRGHHHKFLSRFRHEPIRTLAARLPHRRGSRATIRNWFACEQVQPFLVQARVLNLDDAGMTLLPREINLFTGLRYLFLSNNSLQELIGCRVLGRLKILDLEENPIDDDQLDEIIAAVPEGCDVFIDQSDSDKSDESGDA